jgi:hypothetical protein
MSAGGFPGKGFRICNPDGPPGNCTIVLSIFISGYVKLLDDSVTGWPLSGARGDVVGMDASMNGSDVQNTLGALQK